MNITEQINSAVAEKAMSPMELEVRQNPSIILLDKKKFHEFYEQVAAEVEAFVPDLSTDQGRKAIAALAYKVARTKTAIDEAGKTLNAKLRTQINVVDESRREIREKFDALKDKARKPLTEWEAAEETRIDECGKIIELLRRWAVVFPADTIADAQRQLAAVEGTVIDQAKFQSFYDTAIAAQDAARTALQMAITRITQEDADRAELARLRAEKEAREAAERKAAKETELARLHKEREESEAIRLAEMAEAARLAEEQRVAREAEAVARAAREAEERAKRETEDAARKEAARIERQHQADLEAQKRERLEAEQAAERQHQAELRELQKQKDAIEAEQRKERAAEQARIAEAEKKAAEERKLAANKKHRLSVVNAATAALMARAELEKKQADLVIQAIVLGNIPAVTLSFTK